MNADFREQKTILVVDDKESNIDMLLSILKDYDVIAATSGEDALQLLEDEYVDMILLDIIMPQMDGFEVCRKLKENQETKDLPVIFITAKNDMDSIEKAYDTGGVDYVTKPFRPRELLARVRTHLYLRETIERLNELATRDSLTGVYNRRMFFELAHQMFTSGSGRIFALMFDIDHFKKINDIYGHHSGDIMLKSITKTIGDLLPEKAIFGRVGGEEFAALITVSSPEEARSLVEKIRITVAELVVSAGDGTNLSCTMSIGVAQSSNSITSLDELLQEADRALYQAKDDGRNRTIFRGPGLRMT